jgi:hypothetical protein
MATERRSLVEREVRADDPDLTSEANELLTAELKEAFGAERVRVPAEREEALRRVPAAGHSTLGATLAANRLLVAITFATLVIVALATGSWWAAIAAAGIHAIGTLAVALITFRATTQVEHAASWSAA